MEYIAHKDGERIQTVKEHLYGTAELAGSFAERFGKKEWGYCCGMLHDLGKYSKEFQRKITDLFLASSTQTVTNRSVSVIRKSGMMSGNTICQ